MTFAEIIKAHQDACYGVDYPDRLIIGTEVKDWIVDNSWRLACPDERELFSSEDISGLSILGAVITVDPNEPRFRFVNSRTITSDGPAA
jgi:hypothetical protein